MFRFPFSRNEKSRPIRKARPRTRLEVEILEDRVVPSAVDLFVVPAGTPIDNVTHFASLQAALSAASLNGTNGSVIQIEPGSSPGNIAGLTLPNAANLTIQGDPGAGLSAIPQFTLSDASLTITQVGWTLKNVNIGLIQGSSSGSPTNGVLVFNANGTLTGSNIVNLDSAGDSIGDAITFNGNADVLTNSTLTNDSTFLPLSGGDFDSLLEVNLNGTAANNLISGNTFVANQPVSGLVNYFTTTPTAVTDQVIGNTFIGSFPADSFNNAAVGATGPISGLTIANNALSLSSGLDLGIGIICASSSSCKILNNAINGLAAASSTGILIFNGASGTSTVTVAGNQIQTTNSGLDFQLTRPGTVDAIVQGNGNGFEVTVSGSGSSASGIDLGGGSQGSLGGNDFRGGGILTASGTTGTFFAKHNIFSAGIPSSFTTQLGAKIDPSINTTNLTGNAAFVETLYIDYLHRAGDTTNPSDAGFWVNQLNSGAMSQAQVVNALLRSGESLGDQVNALYLKILARPADSGGLAFFVNSLEHGGTLEQVEISLFSSAEYAALTGSDGAFIQSLYNKVLGRIGSNAEVQGWLSALPSLSRAAVANAFLFSAEFRGDAVEQLYGDPLAQAASTASPLPNLLHRASPPSVGDLNFWINSGLDLLSIEAAIAGSGEFFTNG